MTGAGQLSAPINPRAAAVAAELLSAALGYAARNLPVFPCRPDKRPCIGRDKDRNGQPIPRTGGLYKATTDERQIRVWWTIWPLAMIGMPTGSRSGLVVVDVDVKSGVDGFATMRAHGWTMPADAIEVRTPSGGAHFYFRLAPGQEVRNSSGKIGPGLDVRGDGGYVILPPSRPSLDGPDYRFAEGQKCHELGRRP